MYPAPKFKAEARNLLVSSKIRVSKFRIEWLVLVYGGEASQRKGSIVLCIHRNSKLIVLHDLLIQRLEQELQCMAFQRVTKLYS